MALPLQFVNLIAHTSYNQILFEPKVELWRRPKWLKITNDLTFCDMGWWRHELQLRTVLSGSCWLCTAL